MFAQTRLSLTELLGEDYLRAVCDARAFYTSEAGSSLMERARRRVDFYPEARQRADDALLARVGERVIAPFLSGEDGAPTDAFRKAAHSFAAPVGGGGCTRVGEDGRLYFIAKSEHYHAPLGHAFGGYELIDLARSLGVNNAAHNNTRGYVVRRAEKALTEAAGNGLDRVINLETGSLAVEAGVKMMLSRFWRLDKTYAPPIYEGRTPVFLVMADADGGREANYHGTTVLTQIMRGMWPELSGAIEGADAFRVVPVRLNDAADFERKIRENNEGKFKTAGFLHEIVMMNYGGIRLTPAFLRRAYELCRETDTPALCDEIQSCMWYGGMYLFRKYGLSPDFVIVGKGFPGGEYPASKILTNARMDSLNQFGALVTNGQEELAALAYLITMRFSADNAALIDELGARFQAGLEELARKHDSLVVKAEGLGHLGALHFDSAERAADFAKRANGQCIDVSAQTYKANCPPAALVKPPLIASEKALDWLIARFDALLTQMEGKTC